MSDDEEATYVDDQRRYREALNTILFAAGYPQGLGGVRDLAAEIERLRASIAFKDDAMLTAMRNLVANDATIVQLTKERNIAWTERDAAMATATGWEKCYMDACHRDAATWADGQVEP